MERRTISVNINNTVQEISVEAENIYFPEDGSDILFEKYSPPGSEASWREEGYTIQPFLTEEENNAIRDAVEIGIKHELTQLGINTDGFTLEKYHTFVDDIKHLSFINKIRAGGDGTGGIPYHYLTVPIERIEKRISEICNTTVTAIKSFQTPDKKIITAKHFWIRVVRPGRYTDNNPPHKDIHIPRVLKSEESRQVVNLYYPLAGSNERSSLPIMPGSHLWPEDDMEITYGKVYCNNIEFTNPAVVWTKHGLNLITPNPRQGEVMVFTPYAIHGGGFNFNTDVTRVSLEMRFWRP